MKNFIFIPSGNRSAFTIFLLAFLITGCGKKDSASDSDSKETKKETTRESTPDQSSSNNSKTELPAAPSENLSTDELIDEYEEIMDQYVAVVKDVHSGNMTDMNKMQELSTKASAWTRMIGSRSSQFTESQKERMKKISEQAEAMLKN